MKPLEHITFASYAAGFLLSLALTLAAFYMAFGHWLPGSEGVGAVLVLALVQFAVQCVAFLHLGSSRNSRERLAFLGATAVVVFILVGGSLWIMHNLNGRMMPPEAQMDTYMDSQSGL